jgi:hypothetical protein
MSLSARTLSARRFSGAVKEFEAVKECEAVQEFEAVKEFEAPVWQEPGISNPARHFEFLLPVRMRIRHSSFLHSWAFEFLHCRPFDADSERQEIGGG